MEVIAETTVPQSVTTDLLSWPEGSPATSAWMLGSGSAGLVEVVQIPPALSTEVSPGLGLVTFATPALEARLETCRVRGQVTSRLHEFHPNPTTSVSAAITRVGGIPFELVRYERDDRGG